MAIDFVPTRREIRAARIVKFAYERHDRPVSDRIREIAEWPLEQAGPEPAAESR